MKVKKMLNKLLLAIVALIMVSGCTSLDQLKKHEINPKIGFKESLAQKYKDFAVREEAQYDWADSAYFARKALRALKGADVLPENVDSWDIAEQEHDNLLWGRSRVMNVRTSEVMNKYPEELAEVQSLYDCWIEEQEEAWQTEDINKCRMDFLLAVTELEKKVMPAFPKVSVEDIKPVVEQTEEGSAIYEDRIVYFSLGSSKMNNTGKKIVGELLETIKEMKSFVINVNGHTDTSGSNELNDILSQKRANSVANEFIAGGVDKSNIVTKAFGESAPFKPTADGVKEPLNRRVEINVSGK